MHPAALRQKSAGKSDVGSLLPFSEDSQGFHSNQSFYSYANDVNNKR